MHPARSLRLDFIGLLVAVTATLTSLGVHAAPIVAVSQARSVSATVSASIPGSTDNDSDSSAAPDFGPFNGSVSPNALAQSATSGRLAVGDGLASQVSSFSSSTVSADGKAQAKLGLSSGENGAAAASHSSIFEFVFDLIEASIVTLTGTVDTVAVTSGGAGIPSMTNEFLFENVTTSTTLLKTLSDDEAFSLSGLLDPGRYRLSAFATVDASESSIVANARSVDATSSYSFNLSATTNAVPEPASFLLVLTALALACTSLTPRRSQGTQRLWRGAGS